jgi:multidrug efflux pump subunit AcrB
MALIAGLVDPIAGSFAWSIASSALFVWLVSLLGTRMLFSRANYS